MSVALTNLQTERGVARAPILMGLPPHPALRSDLTKLDFGVGEGELELLPDQPSQILVQLLGGSSVPVHPPLACPIRAVVRVETLDAARASVSVTEAMDGAVERFLISLGPSLDELPSFVRENARRFACSLVGKRQTALSSLPLFTDTTGAGVSFDEIAKTPQQSWAFTTLEPPFPDLKRRCVRCTRDEVKQLKPLVSLRSADQAITRARESLRRRNAPAVEHIGLGAEERGLCLVTRAVATGTLTGEVGVLAPRQIDKRGILVHIARRPLCRLDDAPGFPIVAVVNDDSLKPDAGFERIAHVKRAARLANDVRDVARAALQETFCPPTDVFASQWVEYMACGPFRVTGWFWLPATPPRIPRVMIDSAFTLGAAFHALRLAEAPTKGIVTAIPIEGRLLVESAVATVEPAQAAVDRTSAAVDRALDALSGPDALGNSLGELALAVAANLVHAAASSPVTDEYATHLALLGKSIGAPTLATTDGTTVGIVDVRAELERCGVVWRSDGRGSIEGEFPTATPAFVLADNDSPGMRALLARLDPRAFREVGSLTALVSHPELGAVDAPGNVQPAATATPPTRATGASFWRALGDRMSELFSGGPPGEAMGGALHARLAELLRGLNLAGDPIDSVVDVPEGRPVRYDPKRRRLLMCSRHPVVARLAGEPDGLERLAAAALCEVNRALVEVTDAEERRALVALLALGG